MLINSLSRIVEGQVMGSPPRQCAGSFCIVCQEVSSQVQHLSVRPSALFAGSCAFYLFPKVKSALKGTRFESVKAVKKKTARVLKKLIEEDFQHCIEQWKICMERCRDRGGVYIEGDNK